MKLFEVLYNCEECEIDDDDELLTEARVKRQFRRYGDRFKRQFRCMSGPKQGRVVPSPEKCGIRKDPKRIRIGKKSARMKKGSRVRRTLFTKRKTLSKRLSRMNKVLRGDSGGAKIKRPAIQKASKPKKVLASA